MLRVLRTIRNVVSYRYRYPDAAIHSKATVSRSVSLQGSVRIGAGASLRQSALGAGTLVGSNCALNQVESEHNVALYDGGSFHDCTIGCYSYFASQARVSMAEIGRFCSVGPYLICGHGDHPTDFASTSPVFFSTGTPCGVTFASLNCFEERKRIRIGHDVWIGARVFIRDGVQVGTGAIIAAGSVVVKDVPDYAIVGGVPAKTIRFRFPREIVDRLLILRWWEWPEEKLRMAQPLFAQNNVESLLDWAAKDAS